MKRRFGRWLLLLAAAGCGGAETEGEGLREAQALSKQADYTVTRGQCRERWRVSGAGGEHLGQKALRVGDVDRDHFPDVLVTRRPSAEETELMVLSGRRGRVLRRWRVAGQVESLALLPDLDRDRVSDLLVRSLHSQPGTGGGDLPSSGGMVAELQAVSLGRLRPLWQRSFAEGAPDFNLGSSAVMRGSELWLGAPGHWGADGRLVQVDPKTGSTRRTVAAPTQPNTSFGDSLALAPDLDGDRLPDLYVSAPLAPEDGPMGSGQVYGLGLKGGTAKWVATGASSEQGEFLMPDFLGDSLTRLGSASDSRNAGVVAGAHGHTPRAAQAAVGQVKAFTPGGALKWAVSGRRLGESFGLSLAGAGPDLDGDGVPEVAAGAPSAGVPFAVIGLAGRAAILSGKTGATVVEVIGRQRSDDYNDRLGAALAWLYVPGVNSAASLVLTAPGARPAGQAEAGLVVVLDCGTGSSND